MTRRAAPQGRTSSSEALGAQDPRWRRVGQTNLTVLGVGDSLEVDGRGRRAVRPSSAVPNPRVTAEVPTDVLSETGTQADTARSYNQLRAAHVALYRNYESLLASHERLLQSLRENGLLRNR